MSPSLSTQKYRVALKPVDIKYIIMQLGFALESKPFLRYCIEECFKRCSRCYVQKIIFNKSCLRYVCILIFRKKTIIYKHFPKSNKQNEQVERKTFYTLNTNLSKLPAFPRNKVSMQLSLTCNSGVWGAYIYGTCTRCWLLPTGLFRVINVTLLQNLRHRKPNT